MTNYLESALPARLGARVAPSPAILAEPQGATIEVTDVSRRFEGPDGPINAVNNVDLTIETGEFCVIVGPSGCGKTTLLRMIAGLERPSSGTISLRRRDDKPAENAMVFQGRSVFPWLRVRDNVTYGLRLRGVDRAERNAIADDLLRTVGLT